MQIKNLLYGIPLLIVLAACSPAATTSTPIKLPTIPAPIKSVGSACQKISIEPTPDTKDTSLFPPVTEKDFAAGSKDAPMTIIEYGDFQ